MLIPDSALEEALLRISCEEGEAGDEIAALLRDFTTGTVSWLRTNSRFPPTGRSNCNTAVGAAGSPPASTPTSQHAIGIAATSVVRWCRNWDADMRCRRTFDLIGNQNDFTNISGK